MSAWSGVAIVAIAFAIAVVAAGQPVWQWHLSDGSKTEIWSYGLLGATHTIRNETTGVAATQSFSFSDLAGQNQTRMASLFQTVEYTFEGLLTALVIAAGLSVATLRRKLRGLFAGAALVVGCLLAVYGAISLVVGIPEAAGDLPRVSNQPLPNFAGQLVVPRTGGPGTVLTWGPLMGWYLVLGLVLVFAFGASEVWSLRPERKHAPKAAAPAVVTQQLPPPPAPPAPDHLEPQIEEVFVIGSNGLLIKHMSRTLMSEKDRDVVGGMIAVLSSFVREAFTERDGNDMQEVTLGEHRFVLCSDLGVVVAVLVTRGATEDIVPRLRHLLACLLDRYGTKLDDWGGETLEGIEDEISVLWEPFFLPPPPAE